MIDLRLLWLVVFAAPVFARAWEPDIKCGSILTATKTVVDKLANEGFIEWEISTDRECPDSLDEIAALLGLKRAVGPDHQALWMVCGAEAPEAANGFGVIAAGSDRLLGTRDDIKSWESYDLARWSPPPRIYADDGFACPCCRSPPPACIVETLAADVSDAFR